MNNQTEKYLDWLSKNLADYNLQIRFGAWPSMYDNIANQALSLKRQLRYDESIITYVDLVEQIGYLPTELGRSIAKVCAAYQAYDFALPMLLVCANVKWSQVVKAPDFVYKIDPEAAKRMEQELPTASAGNFYDLRDAMVSAAKGNVKPLLKLSAEFSGNESAWRAQYPNNYIIQMSRAVLSSMDIDY